MEILEILSRTFSSCVRRSTCARVLFSREGDVFGIEVAPRLLRGAAKIHVDSEWMRKHGRARVESKYANVSVSSFAGSTNIQI